LKVDLHIHTDASDGSISIKELLNEIETKEMGLFSITDHEVISHIDEIRTFSNRTSIKHILGCEVTVNADGKRHILAYNIDPNNKDLRRLLDHNQSIVKSGKDGESANFPDAKEAIETIKKAGGVAILAHPGCPFYEKDYKVYIEEMFADGIEGIECYHPDNSQEVIDCCLEFCRVKGLIVTGGSDYHGHIIRERQLDMMNLRVAQLDLKFLME